MHRGYIKIWRKLEDSGLLQMHGTLALLMYILLKATHKPTKIGTTIGVVELDRGQYISGRHKLSAAVGLSEREIRTCLSRLEQLGIISIKTTSKYSIYTIVNYSNYQDIDQQTTSTRPTDDQQSTTKQTHKHISTEVKPMSEYSDEFESFWKSYPSKTGKGSAWKAWKKEKPVLAEVLKTLDWQIKSDQWLKDNGQYIPMPTTYLNQRRFEDTPKTAIQKRAWE